MIVGIGVDVVNVPRFAATLHRAGGLLRMHFAPEELYDNAGQPRSAASLAARYAAKEAASKALGQPSGLRHADCQVRSGAAGEPELIATGSVASAARAAGVTRWHLSMSFEGDVALAMVIAEGARSPDPERPAQAEAT